MSIMFNEICINEEMLPKYIYIYKEKYFPYFKLSYVVQVNLGKWQWYLNLALLDNCDEGWIITLFIKIYMS